MELGVRGMVYFSCLNVILQIDLCSMHANVGELNKNETAVLET